MKFYDTNGLLTKAGLMEEDEYFQISSITLQELENIKTSAQKDADVKYRARQVMRFLETHPENYSVTIYTTDMVENLFDDGIEITNDIKILASALAVQKIEPELIFITNDLSLKAICRAYFPNLAVESVDSSYVATEDDYCGYKEVQMSDEVLSDFYTYKENIFNLKINEYLIIEDQNGQPIDKYRWTEEGFVPVSYNNFYSIEFGNVKPMKDDVYQACAADSLTHNTITMIKGPAGTGKTYLSLAYLFSQLHSGKIDKIIIFCNTVATKNSAKLGFYPGTRDEKLLDSQIGNLLSSKMGDKGYVEDMIAKGRLVLLPLSDIRGYDTSGMHAGIYISEAQNLDVSLMKLALQRIGDDSICIIDGDEKTQVDDISYAGDNNGMRRASKVFRGTDLYGEISLRTIHRSRIAEIAEQM